MSRELIVATNPAKRRKTRTAAQKRATAKMIAANRKKARGGGSRRRSPPKRRTRAAARTTSRRRAPQRRRNTVQRASAYPRRRNPTMQRTVMGIWDRQVMPALIGGAGGVANDVLYGFLPIPEEFRLGNFRHVGKAASAIGLGWLSTFVVGRKMGDQIAAGALTVVGYNLVRELVARFAPDINMGMFLDPSMGMFLEPELGLYPSPGLNPDFPLAGWDDRIQAGVNIRPQLRRGRPYQGSRRAVVDNYGMNGDYETMGAYHDGDASGYSEYQ